MRVRFLSILFVVLTYVPTTFAAGPAFVNVTEDDLKNIIGDMSANFMHTSVSGASTLGSIFGFQLGLIAGMTTSDNLKALAKEADPTNDFDKAMHAGILARITVPYGITIESTFIPTIDASDMSFSTFGLAAMWTATDSVLSIPLINLSAKLHYNATTVKVTQTTTTPVATQGEIELKDSIYGMTFYISQNFAIIEPYFGIGFASATGDLSYTGTGQIFDNTLTTGNSAESAESTSVIVAGLELDLMVLQIGAEYQNAFGNDRYTAKLAFGF